MIEFIQAVLFGIIQGITEYLPISSTAHLILFNNFTNVSKEFFDVFKVVIQFGSILAVCVLYYHRLNPWSSKKNEHEKRQTLTLWSKIIVGILPALVFGLLLNDLIDDVLSANYVIAITLIVYGVAFIIIESYPRKATVTKMSDLSYLKALEIGFFQCLALVPGTSRSGATILGGTLLGCSRTVASEFSFFLAVPVMAGASLLKVVKFGFNYTGIELMMLIVATLVSFIVSIIAIKTLLTYIKKHDFKVFGYYRIILGILVIIFLVL